MGPRYEREVNQGHRPLLRRITERDDAAGLAMVLCVCAINAATNAPESAPPPPARRGSVTRTHTKTYT
jgi:hypothetical protein